MLNYEKKYLKYKVKYLELKKQIGGVLDCTYFNKSKENAKQLVENFDNKKCKDEDIINFGLNNFIKLGYIQLNKNQNLDMIKLFPIADLKKEGFSARALFKLDQNFFNLAKLHVSGKFTKDELINETNKFTQSEIAYSLIKEFGWNEAKLNESKIEPRIISDTLALVAEEKKKRDEDLRWGLQNQRDKDNAYLRSMGMKR
jgi:hypothetical protein